VKQSAMTAGMFAFGKFRVFPAVKLAVDKDAINKLKRTFNGSLIVPGDPGYDEARRLFTLNPDTDKHPAIVAQCKGEEDVLRCIDFAHRQQMEVAVRSGNHSFLDWGSCDKGIVIDLSQMKGVAVDPAKRKAQGSAPGTRLRRFWRLLLPMVLHRCLVKLARWAPALRWAVGWATSRANMELPATTSSRHG